MFRKVANDVAVTFTYQGRRDTPPPTKKVHVPQVFQYAGYELISASTARIVSAGMLLAAVMAAAAFFLVVRRSPPPEDELIRRKNGTLLVEVQPLEAPADHPVVYVTGFDTLVRLAERYHLLIMYWSGDGSTTYTVHDDGTAFRYTTGTAAPAAPAAHGSERTRHPKN